MTCATLRVRGVTMGAGGATADRVLADLSDAVLICRTRTGDAAAYRLLYERHAAAARGLARHFVNSEAAAEEAVSETFARVLTVLWRGGGPQEGFRPYLLTSVRRTLHHHHHDNDHGRSETYDPAEPLVEPGLEDLAPNMIARAFRSLPERWQAVLWHTEIEGQRPAEVAPLLGLPAN